MTRGWEYRPSIHPLIVFGFSVPLMAERSHSTSHVGQCVVRRGPGALNRGAHGEQQSRGPLGHCRDRLTPAELRRNCPPLRSHPFHLHRSGTERPSQEPSDLCASSHLALHCHYEASKGQQDAESSATPDVLATHGPLQGQMCFPLNLTWMHNGLLLARHTYLPHCPDSRGQVTVQPFVRDASRSPAVSLCFLK